MASPTAVSHPGLPGLADPLDAPFAGWEVHYAQLGAGRCRGRRAGVRMAHLHLLHESWSLSVLKRGCCPRGWVTFLIPAGGARARIQGRRVEPGAVVAFFDGDEFHYRSSGEAQLLTASIERATLDAHTRTLLGRGFGELRLQGLLGGLRADPVALRELCRHPERHDVAVTLVKGLLGRFENPRAAEPTGRGHALAMKAEAWLRQNLSEPPSVARLCDALGASERTLHEAFREHLDDTPKSYLKTLRLNAARQDLLEARAGRRVTDVALDWGFVHFGWFSQDYRRQFGETPSQTLHLARARFEQAAGYGAMTTVHPRANRVFHRSH